MVSEQLIAQTNNSWRNIAVMVSAESKLHKHFQTLNETFGESTCEDLKELKQEKLAADLHAAVAACLHQQYPAALVSTCHHQSQRLWHGIMSATFMVSLLKVLTHVV